MHRIRPSLLYISSMITFFAVLVRIFSNSMSNVFQKQLTEKGTHPSVINFIMYFGLTICCVPFLIGVNWSQLSYFVWLSAILGGLFGALGNYYLVKALENGELSILGPINAYKSVVAMLAAVLLLKEIPSIIAVLGIFLIIAGSYVVFGTQQEGFSLKLLMRKDIQYRIFALIFTAVEAVLIKNVIIATDIKTSFIFWCFFGMLFSGLILLIRKQNFCLKSNFAVSRLLLIILCMGLMQYSTNFVFSRMNVSYALALFQLSTILSVILGWRCFQENQICQKLFGSFIMMIGAVLIILSPNI